MNRRFIGNGDLPGEQDTPSYAMAPSGKGPGKSEQNICYPRGNDDTRLPGGCTSAGHTSEKILWKTKVQRRAIKL